MISIENYNAYIAELTKTKDPFIIQMEQYAKEHHVPIMDNDAIESFIGLLQIQQPTRILEIGSAIGYSAIRIVTALAGASIVTIERDADRYSKAIEFINRSGLADRIHIIEADALEPDSDEVLNETYDALFIDAAKGQYKRFFEKYSPVVNREGLFIAIICSCMVWCFGKMKAFQGEIVP